MSYNTGTLWNCVTQLDASKTAINTYAGSSSIRSDLLNSYAWDTAIVYIQQAGHRNYANQKGTNINTNLTNTGVNGDEVCKINDMGSNIREWITEYSSYTINSRTFPCTYIGGYCYDDLNYTSKRGADYSTDVNAYIGFRLGLYL